MVYNVPRVTDEDLARNVQSGVGRYFDEQSSDYHDHHVAELDIQFKADSSFGLSKQRYGWYSNDTIFDSTFFSETDGLIRMTTSATADDSARLRSAYPGVYYPHTAADASLGMRIPSQHLQYDADNYVSLTHGEISAEIVEWNESTDSGQNAAGFSFEADAVYVQVRANDENTHFVPQEEWNVDPMDGTGPSNDVLQPEDGLIYNVTYSWYGFGNFCFQVYSKETGRMQTVHVTRTEGGPSINTPNMPIQVTVENKGTADGLGADVGGMVFATHGTSNTKETEEARTLEVVRHTTTSYIGTNATFNNNSIDPFAEPGVPLVSIRRDESDLESRVSLNMQIIDAFCNATSNMYLILWDEYDDSGLTNSNFRSPDTSEPSETRVLVDTEATDYTPSSSANIRGIQFLGTGNQSTEFQTGDASTRIPLEATLVLTAVLAPGANATDAQPAILEVREDW